MSEIANQYGLVVEEKDPTAISSHMAKQPEGSSMTGSAHSQSSDLPLRARLCWAFGWLMVPFGGFFAAVFPDRAWSFGVIEMDGQRVKRCRLIRVRRP